MCVLTRIIRRIKARFPSARILVRGDSGFCMPRILNRLEELNRELGDVDFVLGIAKNPRLLAMAATAMQEAERQHKEAGHHIRHFTSIRYAAATWRHERHVVVKAEHHIRGPNPRFVVTTLDDFDAGQIYDVVYCPRGQAENYIKDLKNALKADRLSCSSFFANFFRLLLHAAAYRLMHQLRVAARAVAPALARRQFDTLRTQLLKVAAHVEQTVRRIRVRLPRVFPLARAFQDIARYLQATRPDPAPS